jgi:pyruvate formate lyase activating enzyme
MMKIGGLQKVSLIEYPGKICAIIFFQGCNFRCPYCHNPELVNPELYTTCMDEDAVYEFLKKRKGKLDAVSITGGEPTIQQDLVTFLKIIKGLGYFIKLDTNGSNPEFMSTIIGKKLVNYIAMDVKGPLQKYKTLTRSQVEEDGIQRSINIIMQSEIPYEFRTTLVKSQLDRDDIFEVGKLIKKARLYILQQFIASKTLDQNYMHELTYTREELEVIKEKLMDTIDSVVVR